MSSIDLDAPLVKSLDNMKPGRFWILAIIALFISLALLGGVILNFVKLFKDDKPAVTNIYYGVVPQ